MRRKFKILYDVVVARALDVELRSASEHGCSSVAAELIAMLG